MVVRYAWLLVLLIVGNAAAMPEQVHLSQEDGRVSVTWAMPGLFAGMSDGFVEFGPDASLGQRVEGEFVAYLDSAPYVGFGAADIQRDFEEAPVTIFRAYLPATVMGPDGPTRHFYYQITDGSGEQGALQAMRSLPGRDEPVTIVHYADQATTQDGEVGPPLFHPVEVAQAAAAVGADVALAAGDLAYQEEGQVRFWNQWFQINEPVFAQAPFFAAPGNHDNDQALGYYHWDTRFDFPGDEHTYSFDAGPVHVVMVNSDEMCLEGMAARNIQRVHPDCRVGATNPLILQFLNVDLRLAEARGMPWTVVVFHHPPYSTGSYRESTAAGSYARWMRDTWLPVLEANGADLVINGHDHNYQRTYPIIAEAATRTDAGPYNKGDGIVYVISGGGGLTPVPANAGEMPPWQATHATVNQYLVVRADDYRLNVASVAVPSGAELDNFTIVRSSLAAAESSAWAPGANLVLPPLLVLVALAVRRLPQAEAKPAAL